MDGFIKKSFAMMHVGIHPDFDYDVCVLHLNLWYRANSVYSIEN